MQARLAILLRSTIIWLTQAVITSVGFWVIDKLLNRMLLEIQEAYDLSADDSRIIVANNLLDAATFIGVGSATVASKIPIKMANKLGFANGKVVKRTVSKEGAAKVVAKDKVGAASKISGKVTVDEVAEHIATSRGITLAKVKSLLGIMTTIIAVPTGVFFAFAQYIDFANWQGPYQRYFQNLLSKIGINPDTPMPKASVVSADIWKRIYSTIEELEPLGVSFPISGVDKPYSRLALADLVDEIAANLAKNGESTSYKNVLALVLPLVQLKTKDRSDADIDAIFSKLAVAPADAQSKNTSIQTTKVFTGIVSQGVVGKGLEFTARPDDMIDSADELRQAAANNLAPYLNALLGKIVYEVKVVASIITKEGFKQTGTTQRIKTGTDKYGNAQYKTVTNKFATLTVYALTDKGSRAKLTTIVLGPVNSAKLVVGQNDLRTLESQLPADVTTTNISEIKGIETSNPVTVTTPPQQSGGDSKAPDDPSNKYNTATGLLNPRYTGLSDNRYWWPINVDGVQYQIGPYIDMEAASTGLDDEVAALRGAGKKFKAGNRSDSDLGFPSLPNAKSIRDILPPTTTTTPPTGASGGGVPSSVGANARTLTEWYQARGQSLPSVQARSLIYAGFGLGQSNYYTGTSEQNTKLLNALKAS